MQDLITSFWQGIEKHHYIPLVTMFFTAEKS
jgi:hypothetical protein